MIRAAACMFALLAGTSTASRAALGNHWTAA